MYYAYGSIRAILTYRVYWLYHNVKLAEYCLPLCFTHFYTFNYVPTVVVKSLHSVSVMHLLSVRSSTLLAMYTERWRMCMCSVFTHARYTNIYNVCTGGCAGRCVHPAMDGYLTVALMLAGVKVSKFVWTSYVKCFRMMFSNYVKQRILHPHLKGHKAPTIAKHQQEEQVKPVG